MVQHWCCLDTFNPHLTSHSLHSFLMYHTIKDWSFLVQYFFQFFKNSLNQNEHIISFGTYKSLINFNFVMKSCSSVGTMQLFICNFKLRNYLFYMFFVLFVFWNLWNQYCKRYSNFQETIKKFGILGLRDIIRMTVGTYLRQNKDRITQKTRISLSNGQFEIKILKLWLCRFILTFGI